MNKSAELFGLNKIPDSEIIKAQQVEIGKLKAYIYELEECVKNNPEIEKLKYENQGLRRKIIDLEFNKRNKNDTQIKRLHRR